MLAQVLVGGGGENIPRRCSVASYSSILIGLSMEFISYEIGLFLLGHPAVDIHEARLPQHLPAAKQSILEWLKGSLRRIVLDTQFGIDYRYCKDTLSC